MTRAGERLTTRDQNNFNLLRLLAAAAVIITHSYALLGQPENDSLAIATHGQLSFSRLGVYAFFVISGFLIANSLEHSPSLGSFFWKRCLRIFPGLIVALLLIAFIMGPAVTELPVGQYLGRPEPYQYVVGNAVLYAMKFSLPGVFQRNPYPDSVNGSLWTLAYEWTCYGLLAGLRIFGPKIRPAICAVLVAGTLGLCAVIDEHGPYSTVPLLHLNSHHLLRFSCLFFSGALWLPLRHRVPLSGAAALSLVAGIFALRDQRLGFYWMILSLPYILFWLASLPLPARITRRFIHNDFSYGLYIYAFAVGQVLACFCAPHLNSVTLGLATLLCTLPLAVASWHLVEQPMLRFKAKGGAIAPGHAASVIWMARPIKTDEAAGTADTRDADQVACPNDATLRQGARNPG